MAIVPRPVIEIDMPKVTDVLPLVQFSYAGSYEVLPEVAPEGTVVLHHGRTFVYNGGLWVELVDLVSSGRNLVDELMEVLNKYKNNSLAKDILDLIETYKVCGYE